MNLTSQKSPMYPKSHPRLKYQRSQMNRSFPRSPKYQNCPTHQLLLWLL
jgi:hypothetical protein